MAFSPSFGQNKACCPSSPGWQPRLSSSFFMICYHCSSFFTILHHLSIFVIIVHVSLCVHHGSWCFHHVFIMCSSCYHVISSFSYSNVLMLLSCCFHVFILCSVSFSFSLFIVFSSCSQHVSSCFTTLGLGTFILFFDLHQLAVSFMRKTQNLTWHKVASW